MELKVIAHAQNGFSDKFGIPRQSREESGIETHIVFVPEYSVKEALRGIEGFSHLWLLWGFSKVQKCKDESDWSPTVRPPRLGGNKRMGVFATRSPFRPNPIGLTSVRLLKVQCTNVPGTKDFRIELIVTGADLMDGTPIYDIKPYLSFSDSHPDAKNGFAEEFKDYSLDVQIADKQAIKDVPEHVMRDIMEILRQDPRPAYQDDPTREYKLDYAGYTVTFTVNGSTAHVRGLKALNC